MDWFSGVILRDLKPYSQRLVDYLYRSGMRFGFTFDSIWFNMHGRLATINRLSQKSWKLYYMSHIYKFYNQSEMIEWIEDQRKYGE